MKNYLITVAFTALSLAFLTGCSSEGVTYIGTDIGDDNNGTDLNGSNRSEINRTASIILTPGTTVYVEGHPVQIQSVSANGDFIEIAVYIESLLTQSNIVNIKLIKDSSGIYQFNTNSLSVKYDPTSGMLSWKVNSDTTLNTLTNEFSELGVAVFATPDDTLTFSNLDLDYDGILDFLDDDIDGDGVANEDDWDPINAYVSDGVVSSIVPTLTLNSNFYVNGNAVRVVSISGDGNEIEIAVYTGDFLDQSDIAILTLVKGSDGLFKFASPSLNIEYDPSSGVFAFKPTRGATEATFKSELSDLGVSVFVVEDDYSGSFPDLDYDGILDFLDDDIDGDGVANEDDPDSKDRTNAFVKFSGISALDPIAAPSGSSAEIYISEYNYDKQYRYSNSIVLKIKKDSSETYYSTYTLRIDENGKTFSYTSTYSGLRITFDPTTKSISWTIEGDLLDENLISPRYAISEAEMFGIDFMKLFWGEYTDWTVGPRSVNSGADLLVPFEASWVNIKSAVENLGFSTGMSPNLSYDRINVPGLKELHEDGWTGKGSNLYVIDNFYQADLFIDIDYYGDIIFTHGANTATISRAVAPEANFSLVEFDPTYSTYYAGTTKSWANFLSNRDLNADAVNFSYGIHFTDAPDITSAFVSSHDFVTNALQPIADQLPNAVIVESAGNNGAVTSRSISFGCTPYGGRNSVDSCTDVFFALDSNYYDALDRTIFVGAYDFTTETLSSYSVSAGLAKEHFIVADGNSVLDFGRGTSYAAPRVTGAVGLIDQKFPNLEAHERKKLLLETATDLGSPGVDNVYGYGLLNVTNALNPLGMLR